MVGRQRAGIQRHKWKDSSQCAGLEPILTMLSHQLHKCDIANSKAINCDGERVCPEQLRRSLCQANRWCLIRFFGQSSVKMKQICARKIPSAQSIAIKHWQEMWRDGNFILEKNGREIKHAHLSIIWVYCIQLDSLITAEHGQNISSKLC